MIKLTFVKLLSVLVASGNGEKCNQAVSSLREFGFSEDEPTKLTKSYLLKYAPNPEDQKRVGKEMYQLMLPLIKEVPTNFFGKDLIS